MQGKILVTGATGFVGGNLSRTLADRGADLRLLVRNPEKLNGLGAAAEVVIGDITDAEVVRRAVEGVDLIYAIAGTFREPNLSDERYLEVNVEAMRIMLDRAIEAGVGRLVFCSTGGIHGSNDGDRPTHEDDPLNGQGIYETSKAEADQLVLDYGRQGAIETVVIRPAPIYGPGDDRLVKLFRIAGKRKPWMLGDGSARYHMIYIDDLSEAFVRAGTVPGISGEAFIAGGPDKPTIEEVFVAVGQTLQIADQQIRKLPAGPFLVAGDICEAICRPLNIAPPIYRRRVEFFTANRDYDTSKAEELLGFKGATGFVEGLRRTGAWYQANGLI